MKYGKMIFLGMLGVFVLVGGCGKKDEEDLAGKQVLEISITPAPSPTPVPEQVNPDAVVTEGSLTMVNGYLVDGIGISRTEAGGRLPEESGTDGEDSAGDSGTDGEDASGESGTDGEDASGESGTDGEDASGESETDGEDASGESETDEENASGDEASEE